MTNLRPVRGQIWRALSATFTQQLRRPTRYWRRAQRGAAPANGGSRRWWRLSSPVADAGGQGSAQVESMAPVAIAEHLGDGDAFDLDLELSTHAIGHMQAHDVWPEPQFDVTALGERLC